MSQNVTPADLGEPDLKVAGLQLWVLGRQFPESDDCYDGNWLCVTAHCGAPGARVWAEGAIVMVTDIADFGDECAAMLRSEVQSATLAPFEPDLKVRSRAPTAWATSARITPDHLCKVGGAAAGHRRGRNRIFAYSGFSGAVLVAVDDTIVGQG